MPSRNPSSRAPNVSFWLSTYNGEAAAVDICYSFTGPHPDAKGGKSPASIMTDGLSRFAICSLLQKLAGEFAVGTFLNGWVRSVGKPRRILLDNGCHGFRNHAWGESSHVFVWQLVQAPPNTQSQNGMAERAALSLKVDVRNFTYTESMPGIEQRISPMAVIEKNHDPHSITGGPPSLARAGRCDILPGFAHAAFNRNPDSPIHAVRNMKHARSAVIHDGANRAIRTCISRSAKDRSRVSFR